ncbi:MAG: 3'-5' exonuclease [Polyangiaceae bacterium]
MAAFPLNPAQLRAVEHQTGPLLVLAGAGSGKTRVITQRVVRLIERGVPPQTIVALTFTNKAAAEMRERIGHALHDTGHGAKAAQAITISTFHSFGLGVLGKEKAAVGGAFTIFDQGDVLAAIKEIMRTVGASKALDAQAIATRISNAKNAFQSAEDLPDDGVDEYDEVTKLVYPKYESAMRGYRAFDFDDLVCGVARLWQTRPDILARWQDRFHYLLVDEYQDTNRAQLALLTALADRHKNICVVGDDDQSIYAWRGADVRNILEFEEQYPGAEVVKLEQNYRSTTPILDVANSVISKRADSKYKKVLFTENAGADKVRVLVAPSPEVEATFVAREIRRMIRDEGMRPKQFAVLYRSNGQAKGIEESLREETVPHKVIGGQQFFERKEVKDLLSYLKVTLNPHDEIALRRVINYPARGIGDTTLERLHLHATARSWTLWQAVERVAALDDIPNGAREGCRQLESLVEETKRHLAKPEATASEVMRGIAERMRLREEISASSASPHQSAKRWGNVEALFRTFERHDARAKTAGATRGTDRELEKFVHALTLDFGDDGNDAPEDVVTLSTLHGSKGLEFDVVFLIGCEEGFLPHSRTLDSRVTDAIPQDIEEERRLFYVGVTRARRRLFLSRAKHRVLRGKPMPRTPSRFLLDIDPALLVEEDVQARPAMSPATLQAEADALLAALDSLG